MRHFFYSSFFITASLNSHLHKNCKFRLRPVLPIALVRKGQVLLSVVACIDSAREQSKTDRLRSETVRYLYILYSFCYPQKQFEYQNSGS